MNTSIDTRILEELKKIEDTRGNIVLTIKAPTTVIVRVCAADLRRHFEYYAKNNSSQEKSSPDALSAEVASVLSEINLDELRGIKGFALYPQISLIGFPQESFHNDLRAMLIKSLGINTETGSN